MAARAEEVDVVVLGCGAGGVTAALAAKRAGADVLVVEHQVPERHTPNVRMSGGWLMTMVSAVEGAEYLSACAGGLVDEAMFLPWAQRAVGLESWLADIGVTLHLADTEKWGLSREEYGAGVWAEHPGLPGAEAVRVWRASTTLPPPYPGRGGQTVLTGEVFGGEAIYRGLMHALAEEGIPVLWGTEPTSLLVDRSGDRPRVTGVRLRLPATDGDDPAEEATEEVVARRAVVIATGGFGGNPELIRQFLTVPNAKFYGNPGNDGSGLRLAMSVGADLVRMNRMVGRGVGSFAIPGGPTIGFMIVMDGGGYVMCDQLGRRYADEHDQAQQQHSFYFHMQEFDHKRVGYTRSPSYYVFDERRRRAGPLTFMDRAACGVGLYDWSADNSREIDAGWISVGDTPGAAAVAAGAADGAEFDAAVAAYNEGCATGDDPFGRPRSSLIPLDQPPYYCVPLYVGGPYSHGGPRRDVDGRIVSVDGEPIPGLFGAGELGQAVGLLYPASGASIAEALCLGEIAGEAAAAG